MILPLKTPRSLEVLTLSLKSFFFDNSAYHQCHLFNIRESIVLSISHRKYESRKKKEGVIQ